MAALVILRVTTPTLRSKMKKSVQNRVHQPRPNGASAYFADGRWLRMSMTGGSRMVFAHQRRQYLRRHQTFSMPS